MDQVIKQQGNTVIIEDRNTGEIYETIGINFFSLEFNLSSVQFVDSSRTSEIQTILFSELYDDLDNPLTTEELILDYVTLFSSPGGGGVATVTGSGVDNTDPANPVINVGTWQPPGINPGSLLLNGASVFRSSGAGIILSFSGVGDDEANLNLTLDNLDIVYDGSSFKLRLYYSISALPLAGETVNLDYDYALLLLGDNPDGKLTEFTDVLDLTGKVANTLYEYESTTLAGLALSKVLQLSIQRNSLGPGADTYGGSFEVIALELIKI